jgi:hypothetical protein
MHVVGIGNKCVVEVQKQNVEEHFELLVDGYQENNGYVHRKK